VTAAPALAHGESLTISFGAQATFGQPLTITAKGVADGAHGLYVYADQSGYSCAPDPHDEYNHKSSVALSSAAGDPLSAGSYSKSYTYVWGTQALRICAYLDDTPSDTPDAFASVSPWEDPVREYLENQSPAQPTGERTVTLPGAIEAAYVNPQVEREFWERVAREAQGHQEREHAEREVQEAKRTIRAGCLVPSLKGDSLRRARWALRHAHCTLGRVSTRRGAHGALVVIRQSPARGFSLNRGAAVALTLGSRKL
jgi:hypothetical protein